MIDEASAAKTMANRRRLAIVGGGSSGLICLKVAMELLPDWDIVCFEKSDRITGCWGNPYPGFVSTSTKYTTQFSCFAPFDADLKPDGGESRAEFFRDDQYGQYLEQFAEKFNLHRNIALQTCVDSIRRGPGGDSWHLSLCCLKDGSSETTSQQFDRVIICTGLAAEPKQIDCDIKTLAISELNHSGGLGHLTGNRIVVIGGGESAVDYANRLSAAELNNKVFLSLQSGIRVSPRYHPIRGVPSDFLRNRLMLSIHEDVRNWIGQRFVEMRIRYQETFEWLFPKSPNKQESTTTPPGAVDQKVNQLHKQWAYKLTKAAKDDLFNMFHNKSDDFLDAVAQERITIVGPPSDRRFTTFRCFDSDRHEVVDPDLIVPAVGYRANLHELTGGEVQLTDFYLGCSHITYADLFLVGFARPIIGNIPTISEVQAQYVCGLIAGDYQRPSKIEKLHRADLANRRSRYNNLNLDAAYPVEMFPYCDQLAKLMKVFPSLLSVGSLLSWCKIQLAPATTMHYIYRDRQVRERYEAVPIYMPMALVLLLLVLKPLDLVYRLFRRLFTSTPSEP